jgi:hypothetical protein
MLKDQERPKETAHSKAMRRWRNHDISTRFKKAQKSPDGANEFPIFDGKKYFATERPKPPKTANSDRRSGTVNRLETKFTKYQISSERPRRQEFDDVCGGAPISKAQAPIGEIAEA